MILKAMSQGEHAQGGGQRVDGTLGRPSLKISQRKREAVKETGEAAGEGQGDQEEPFLEEGAISGSSRQRTEH